MNLKILPVKDNGMNLLWYLILILIKYKLIFDEFLL